MTTDFLSEMPDKQNRADKSIKIRRLKKIAGGALMVVMTVTVLVLALQFANDRLFGDKTIEARTNADFKEKQKQVRLLFLGASDMKAALIPSAFGVPAFNYAIHNEFYIGSYFKLKKCIDDMPDLEMVILPVSPGSFLSCWSLRTDVPAFAFMDSDDFDELYQAQGMITVFQKLRRYYYVMNPSRFKEFLGNLGGLALNRPVRQAEMSDGYRKYTGILADPEKAAVKARVYFSRSEPFDKYMLLYFKKILQLCHDRGIRVVTVTLPNAKPYVETAQAYVTMDQLADRVLDHPDYRPYIWKHFNFLELYSDRQDLFFDANHLNHEGAVMLSERLASALNKMNWSGKDPFMAGAGGRVLPSPL